MSRNNYLWVHHYEPFTFHPFIFKKKAEEFPETAAVSQTSLKQERIVHLLGTILIGGIIHI